MPEKIISNIFVSKLRYFTLIQVSSKSEFDNTICVLFAREKLHEIGVNPDDFDYNVKPQERCDCEKCRAGDYWYTVTCKYKKNEPIPYDFSY